MGQRTAHLRIAPEVDAQLSNRDLHASIFRGCPLACRGSRTASALHAFRKTPYLASASNGWFIVEIHLCVEVDMLVAKHGRYYDAWLRVVAKSCRIGHANELKKSAVLLPSGRSGSLFCTRTLEPSVRALRAYVSLSPDNVYLLMQLIVSSANPI